jgi:hypothetical protein
MSILKKKNEEIYFLKDRGADQKKIERAVKRKQTIQHFGST